MARVIDVRFFKGEAQNPFFDPYVHLFERYISRAILRQSRTEGATLEVDYMDIDKALEDGDGFRSTTATIAEAWYFYVSYVLEGNDPRVQQALLFLGWPENRRNYSRREASVSNRVVFHDALAARLKMSVRPPTARRPNVYVDTDLEREFSRWGLLLGDFPNLAIPRIEYTPDTPVWDTLSPYVSQYEPLIIPRATAHSSGAALYFTGEDGIIRTEAAAGANIGTLHSVEALARDADGVGDAGSATATFALNYHKIEETSAEISGERINCVKLLIAPPPALGISPDVEYDERREEGDPSPGEDGRSIITGEIWWDLHEDPEDEEKVTRSVFMGQFSRTHDAPAEDAALGAQMAGSETFYTWEDDYQRLTRVRTATAAQVDLPGIGRSILMPDAYVEVEETDWQPDPDEPGAYFLKKKTRSESGIVIVVNDDAGNPIFSSGIDAISATRSRVVDVSATSSQRHLDHLIRRTVEDYHATGEDTMSFLTTHYDALRGVSFPGRGGQGIQRSSVRPVPAVIVEYLTRYDDTLGEEVSLAATTIDATLIGRENAEDIAEKLFEADRNPQAIIGSPLLWLEPSRYKHGTAWIVAGMEQDEEEIDGGETGVAVITGITYEFQIEPDLVATQTLELMRPSGVAK